MDAITVDCSTGEVTVAPLTDDQLTALQQAQTEAAAAEQARQDAAAAAVAQRQNDAQVLMAALPTQEARDALRRILGL